MTAITVTERIDFPIPGFEVITATPAHGETYVSKHRIVTGVIIACGAAIAAADAYSGVVTGGNTITFTIIGTARLCTIYITGHD